MYNKTYVFLTKYSVQLLLLCLFLIQLSFISADPDLSITFSRGPWTDEGLYTAQLRNFINNDDLTFENSPCFATTPLYNAILYLPYKIFGASIIVSRLCILLFCLITLSLISRFNAYLKRIILLIIPIVLLQYHIFHFMHYSMAETLAVFSIFTGIIFIYKTIADNSNSLRNNLIAAAFLSFAYCIKITFLYITGIFIVFAFLWLIVTRILDKKIDRIIISKLWKHILFIIGFGLIYILAYYLPNKDFIDYLLQLSPSRNEGMFIDIKHLNLNGIVLDFLYNFYYKFFINDNFILFNLVFILFLTTGSFFLFNKTSNKTYRILFLLSLSWIIIEMSKFNILYLPTRYLISILFPMGLLMVVVLHEGLYNFRRKCNLKKATTAILCLAIGILLFSNTAKNIRAFSNRTYTIKEINDYLKKHNYKDRSIIGPWAATLSSETDAITYPIWKDFLNDREIINKLNPRVIISEINDNDSNGALINDGIIVENIADSIIHKIIAQREIRIIWLP